jgi:hypothetical protein
MGNMMLPLLLMGKEGSSSFGMKEMLMFQMMSGKTGDMGTNPLLLMALMGENLEEETPYADAWRA